MSDRDFEFVDAETIYAGRILTLRNERFRFLEDGAIVEREIVRHSGAVAIVAHDDTDLFLVRQPREAVNDPDCLELPAGRLDKEGEAPLTSAKRELAEEIGKAATDWAPLKTFWPSVGAFDEVVHLFVATGLSDHSEDSGEMERIEIVRWPLADLDGAIAATKDAKTLIGLLLFAERRRATAAAAPGTDAPAA